MAPLPPTWPARSFLAIVLTLGAGAACAQAVHVVRPGDTLTALARRYDTTVAALREANELPSDLLRVGVELRLPGPPGWHETSVPEGTGWSEVAAAVGRSEAALRAANPSVVDPGGRVVRVPPSEGPLLWPREGEDLLSVAARAGVAPSSLAEANALVPPYRIEPGEPLVVPSGAATAFAAPPVPAPGDGGASAAAPPPTSERRAQHAALRGRAMASLGEVLRGERLVPPDEGFAWPLSGVPRLTSHFGWRNVSVGGNRYHQGIDLGAVPGTPVLAAREGVVVRAGWTGAYGYAVYLRHDDGFETRYAHLSRLTVTAGERVGKGATLGAVGSTGASTGPHLHFEARLDGRAVNPLEVLPGAP